jgi:predicted dienelactone hydrolase
MRRYLILTIGLLLHTGVALAGEQTVTLAGMRVSVWSEATAEGTTQPVIIFSHGFHGCATQSRFLMEAFASAGYLVFAPNHRDATCDHSGGSWFDRAKPSFRSPEEWNDTTFRDRADDIRRLIDAIRADRQLGRRADWAHFGLVGHSLGGYTVLGLAGAWPSWRLIGVRAVLALSPYSQPFIVHKTLDGLSAPVMYQGGTLDFGVTPALDKSFGAYDESPAPKYFVEFRGAGHLAWTNLGLTNRQEIVAYSLAFMNRYVRDESAAEPDLTKTLPDVAVIRFAPGTAR